MLNINNGVHSRIWKPNNKEKSFVTEEQNKLAVILTALEWRKNFVYIADLSI
jgi:hypothetical protein